MCLPLPNSILRDLNSIYSHKASCFNLFTFFMKGSLLVPIVYAAFSIVSTLKILVFLSFGFFIKGFLLLSIVSSDFSIVYTQKMLDFIFFYFFIKKMYHPVPNSLLRDLNSIYSQNTSFFSYFTFFMKSSLQLLIVSSDFSIVSTERRIMFFYFSFFMISSQLLLTVSSDLSIVSTERRLMFLFFFFFYDRFPAITNSILVFLNSNNSEKASFFSLFLLFLPEMSFPVPNSILGFSTSIYL